MAQAIGHLSKAARLNNCMAQAIGHISKAARLNSRMGAETNYLDMGTAALIEQCNLDVRQPTAKLSKLCG